MVAIGWQKGLERGVDNVLYFRRGERMAEKKRARTEGQISYQKKYNHDHVVWRKASFNDKNLDDMILMQWIDSQEEKTSAYLKRLVREDMEKRTEGPV